MENRKVKKMQEVKQLTLSPFGLVSGLATTCCFLAPALIFTALIYFGIEVKIATFLYIHFLIVIKFGAEWFFWTRFFPEEIDSLGVPTSWRQSVKKILTSHPDTIRSIHDLFIDLFADAILIFFALKVGLHPSWICLAIFGSHALVALIQGQIVDRLNKRLYRKISMIITVLAVAASFGLRKGQPGFYSQLFGLGSLHLETQALIFILAKNLLAGTSIIAKATIASRIQIESHGKFINKQTD
ncbi:MAG: hypothetical protein JSS30_00720 [Verrucomicrobia bacterium]|nr:hypothetical protein [Verrucomicrobiota bacterium]